MLTIDIYLEIEVTYCGITIESIGVEIGIGINKNSTVIGIYYCHSAMMIAFHTQIA